jgi:hypothetical protein
VQKTGTRSKICTKLPAPLLVDSRTQIGSREKGRQGDTEKWGARVAQNDVKKRPRFVKPWPENVPYLSKDHRLSKSIVQHFAGFCRKCGHSSHWEAKCITYLDMGTTLSLCHHCLQGFHIESDCKSRRPDVRDKRIFREISAILSCPAVPSSALTDMLADISSDAPGDTILVFTKDAEKELFAWAGFLSSDLKWLPICPVDQPTPVKCKEFVSDAAGLAKEADIRTSAGCGNIGFCENGRIIFAN